MTPECEPEVGPPPFGASSEVLELYREPVPASVRRAVSLSLLAGERRVRLPLGAEEVTYEWDTAFGRVWCRTGGVLSDELLRNPYVRVPCQAPIQEVQRHAFWLVRCLKGFHNHPLVRLVPKRNYQFPLVLLPDWYCKRFEHDLTRLDSSVLVKYHLPGQTWLQLPHSGAAFTQVWSSLQRELESGRIL